jgi:polyphosphate kinase
VPGISERILVRSLFGRFLEHERVFVFGAGEEEQFFLSSADWMPRNLDRRVEVMVPLSSEPVRARIRRECLDPLHLDNCRLYEMDSDGGYRRRRPGPGQAPVDPQLLASSPPPPKASESERPSEPAKRILRPARVPAGQPRA